MNFYQAIFSLQNVYVQNAHACYECFFSLLKFKERESEEKNDRIFFRLNEHSFCEIVEIIPFVNFTILNVAEEMASGKTY